MSISSKQVCQRHSRPGGDSLDLMIHITEKPAPMELRRLSLLLDVLTPVKLLHDTAMSQGQLAAPEERSINGCSFRTCVMGSWIRSTTSAVPPLNLKVTGSSGTYFPATKKGALTPWIARRSCSSSDVWCI